jgi:hypothetical protein
MATAAESASDRPDWLFEAVVGAVALVHLVLLVVFPAGVDVATLLAVEGFVALGFVAVHLLDGVPARQASGVVVPLVAAFFGTWALQQALDSLLAVGLVLTLGLALVAYGLHRYELVTLGLVEATHE